MASETHCLVSSCYDSSVLLLTVKCGVRTNTLSVSVCSVVSGPVVGWSGQCGLVSSLWCVQLQ